MNFDEAITVHSQWKQKLSAYLKNPDRSINPAILESDSACELGKWIAANAVRYRDLADFTTLRHEHAGFHKAAADIVRRADKGNRVLEEVSLGSGSEYSNHSSNVVQAIMKMKFLPKS
jgi:hypothetical protein